MIRIKIIQDEHPQCPREWDNLGTMACWHSRYNLGDKDGPEDLRNAIRSEAKYRESWEDYHSDNFRDLTDPTELIRTAYETDLIILPLYFYDHSGIAMNTTGFSCLWDSGQVGVIFVSKKKAREKLCVMRINKKTLDKIKKNLRDEVETYDQYLRGDVYGYKITKIDKNTGEHIQDIDSCWGFYGSNPKTNGMMNTWPAEYQNIKPEFELEYA